MEGILFYKCLRKDFYFKNALKMILFWKYIGSNFDVKMHWKWCYYKNGLEMVLL